MLRVDTALSSVRVILPQATVMMFPVWWDLLQTWHASIRCVFQAAENITHLAGIRVEVNAIDPERLALFGGELRCVVAMAIYRRHKWAACVVKPAYLPPAKLYQTMLTVESNCALLKTYHGEKYAFMRSVLAHQRRDLTQKFGRGVWMAKCKGGARLLDNVVKDLFRPPVGVAKKALDA